MATCCGKEKVMVAFSNSRNGTVWWLHAHACRSRWSSAGPRPRGPIKPIYQINVDWFYSSRNPCPSVDSPASVTFDLVSKERYHTFCVPIWWLWNLRHPIVFGLRYIKTNRQTRQTVAMGVANNSPKAILSTSATSEMAGVLPPCAQTPSELNAHPLELLELHVGLNKLCETQESWAWPKHVTRTEWYSRV